jgi:pimeloyl-ACP methyl ester carboxylesterase
VHPPAGCIHGRPRYSILVCVGEDKDLESPPPAAAHTARLTRRIVQDGRYRIRIVSRGTPEGPQAILLPGMAATEHGLAPQVRLLRRIGYAVHVVDLPGFGLGPPLRKEDAHFTRLAEYVIAAATALGIGPALFLGHSLGGGVALQVAASRPDLVRRLVLLAPAAVGHSLVWTYRLFCLPVVGRALLRPYQRGTRRYLEHFLVGSVRRRDQHFVAALARQDARTLETALTMRAIVWANQPRLTPRSLSVVVPGREQSAITLRARLADLRAIPTLVLWGSEDRVIPASHAAILHQANPDAEVHVAKGVGHLLQLEVPAWTNRHIARFVDLDRDTPLRRVS